MRRMVAACLILICAGLAVAASAAAPDVPLSSLARIMGRDTDCTGTLIGRKSVVTLASCLVDRRTGALYQPGSLTVAFIRSPRDTPFSRTISRAVAGMVVGDRDAPVADTKGTTADWAILTLTEPAPDPATVLPLAKRVTVGTPVQLTGALQSRTFGWTSDSECTIQSVRSTPGGDVSTHDCHPDSTTHGAALLVLRGGRWAVAGIAGHTEASRLAVGSDAFAAEVAASAARTR